MTRTFLAALLAVLVLAGCAKTYEDYPDYRTWRQEQLVGRETGDGPADLGDDKSWHYWKLDSGQCVLDQIVTVGEKEVRVKKSFLFGSDAEMSAYIQKEKTKADPSPLKIEDYRTNRMAELGATKGVFVAPTASGHFYAWQMPDGTFTVDNVTGDGKGGVVVDTAASKVAATMDAAYESAGGAPQPNLQAYLDERSQELGATLDYGRTQKFWLLLGFRGSNGAYTLDLLQADTTKGVSKLKSMEFANLNELAKYVDETAPNNLIPWATGLQYSKFGWTVIGTVLLVVFSVLLNVRRARSKQNLTIRRINGLDQIDEAVGRATETARPVLMVPGLSAQLDGIAVQALTVFAYVVRSAARFRTPIRLLNYNPAVYAVAQEIVRDVYMSEGVPEQFDPDSVRFVTDRQFAFAAAVAGLIQREKVAAAFMMGDFYAESLIFAENANLVGAIQVAATTQFTQTPFFIAACDYVLLGDEFYAASAYLGRQPVLLGSMIGVDWAKMMFMTFTIVATLWHSVQMTQKVDRSKLPPEQRAVYEKNNQVYMDQTKDELFFKYVTKVKRF
ncbi:MAG: DUF6754 domain-containing protein [Fimbriimonadales bacterium]